jgi:diacylglycerol diphosphate phosphatase/phosphatidate phosphatase
MNFVYALYIPLGLQVLYLVVTKAPFHKFHATIISIAVALVLTSVITDTIKDAVGRPRPDLLARCKPAAGTPANTLVTVKVCTETAHHTLHDGWRSFPSGHSSFAFAGLGQWSLWLCGQFRVFRREHHRGRLGGDVGRAILCLLPLLGAALIAISRCEDYRHDVYDVCAGSVLGFGIAHLSYRRWWPRLSARHCDEPYPSPAAEDDERQGWDRVRDEEEAAEHEMPALGGSPP